MEVGEETAGEWAQWAAGSAKAHTASHGSLFPPLLLHPQPTPLPEPTQALRPCLGPLPLCITCEPVRAPFCSPTPPPICVLVPKSRYSSRACLPPAPGKSPPPPQRPMRASLLGNLPRPWPSFPWLHAEQAPRSTCTAPTPHPLIRAATRRLSH